MIEAILINYHNSYQLTLWRGELELLHNQNYTTAQEAYDKAIELGADTIDCHIDAT